MKVKILTSGESSLYFRRVHFLLYFSRFFSSFTEGVLSGLKTSGSIHLRAWIGSSAVRNVIKRGSASRMALELGPIHFWQIRV